VKEWQEFPKGYIYANEGCANCCQCLNPSAKLKNCDCECLCLGSKINYRENDFDYETMLPTHLEKGSIQILYRDKIRVFYDTVGAAKRDDYHLFDKKLFPKSSCILYGYTGLRGDAKDMYRDVGKEPRIELVKAVTPADQGKHIEKADLVIWACGYQTNKVFCRD